MSRQQKQLAVDTQYTYLMLFIAAHRALCQHERMCVCASLLCC